MERALDEVSGAPVDSSFGTDGEGAPPSIEESPRSTDSLDNFFRLDRTVRKPRVKDGKFTAPITLDIGGSLFDCYKVHKECPSVQLCE